MQFGRRRKCLQRRLGVQQLPIYFTGECTSNTKTLGSVLRVFRVRQTGRNKDRRPNEREDQLDKSTRRLAGATMADAGGTTAARDLPTVPAAASKWLCSYG
jgi:hypothetical protein